MHIALIATFYPPDDGGGIGTYTATLAAGLRDRGHRVTVLCRSRVGDRIDAPRDGLRILRYRPRYLPKIESLFPNWRWSQFIAARLDALHRTDPFDVVEFPNWEGVGYHFGRRRHRPAVVTRLHTPFLETLALRPELARSFGARFTCWLERRAVLAADAIACSTRHHAAFMADTYHLDIDAIRILPLGIAVPAPRPPPPEPPPLRILYVSRLEVRKGTLTLLQAIPSVLRACPEARFQLVGSDRPHAPGGRTFARYLHEEAPGCAPQVAFLGHQSADALQQLYAACHCFAVPSNYESFGLVYVEAMAHGKPVIGCRAGGIPEVIDDGVTGLLIAPGDHRALAEAIIALANDAPRRAAMGTAARSQVETRFSQHRLAADSADFYATVAAGR